MLIDMILQRFDAFMNRIQGFQPVATRSQTYRKVQFASEPKKPVALFGADRNEAFALDWSNQVGKPKGGVVPEIEKSNPDGEIDLEKWQPNPDVPSLIPHGRALNYSRNTDQKPILAFHGDIGEKWDGVVRNVTKKPDFQSVRTRREPTVADMHAEDIRKTGYDFY